MLGGRTVGLSMMMKIGVWEGRRKVMEGRDENVVVMRMRMGKSRRIVCSRKRVIGVQTSRVSHRTLPEQNGTTKEKEGSSTHGPSPLSSKTVALSCLRTSLTPFSRTKCSGRTEVKSWSG